MNNKGFAVTTIIYSVLILLFLCIFLVLGILKNEYVNQKDMIDEINLKLETCLERREC